MKDMILFTDKKPSDVCKKSGMIICESPNVEDFKAYGKKYHIYPVSDALDGSGNYVTLIAFIKELNDYVMCHIRCSVPRDGIQAS